MKQPIILTRVFPISCSFRRQNLFHEETCCFQDLFIPDLNKDTYGEYGEFLLWRPGLGVFTLEKFFSTEEDSRVSIQSTKAKSEELWGQKIKPVPTTETSVIPKIKVANSSPKVEKRPIKETYAAPNPKLPRSLAVILDEVWAASLGVKQEEPTQSSSEIQMI